MNSNPLVSIITPVYNHEEFIGDTINSVINQTYQNWEMLVVDDCSTDNSWEIIQECAKKDNRIKIFRNAQNKGLIPNWKFLIDNSRGKYIAFLEGDDMFYPQNIEKKIKVFKNFTEVGMVYCNFVVINDVGDILVKNHLKEQKVKTFKNESISPSEYLFSRFHLINSYSQTMIKREILKKVGYPRSLDNTEKIFLPSDWDFNFRVSTKNNIYYIDDPLFLYRKHGNNNSYDAVKAYKHISLLLDDYRKIFFKDNNVLKAIDYKHGRFFYSKILYYIEHEKKREAWKEFSFYCLKFKSNIFLDLFLNLKIIIRLLIPNKVNRFIKYSYYKFSN